MDFSEDYKQQRIACERLISACQVALKSINSLRIDAFLVTFDGKEFFTLKDLAKYIFQYLTDLAGNKFILDFAGGKIYYKPPYREATEIKGTLAFLFKNLCDELQKYIEKS